MPYYRFLQTILRYRRLYHDILLVYKSLSGYTNITRSSPGLELSRTASRRGGFWLNHLHPKSEVMTDNFCFRARQEWDSLPDSFIKRVFVAALKSAFRQYFENIV